MADNIDIPDFSGTSKTMRTLDDSNVHTPITASDADMISATFNRPADTTAYAAGDAVTNSTSSPSAMSFSGMAQRNGAPLTIVSAILYSSNAPPSLPPSFQLFIFNTSSAPTATNDNSAFALSDGDADNCVAVINFYSSMCAGATNNMIWEGILANGVKTVKPDASSTTLYGLLKILDAYTPANAETFQVMLGVIRD